MKFVNAIALLMAGLAVPAMAQAPDAPKQAAGPDLAPGAAVFDPQGGEVGRIESISGDTVILDTGASKATLPKSAFGTSAKGPSVNATKAQIDTMVAAANAKATAALDAALVPGAEIRGKAGAVVGTVKELTADGVVIDRQAGPVTLTKKAFTLAQGTLTIAMTAAELDAAAKAASTQPAQS